MVLEVFLRLSCICLLLCGSGFGYPFQTKVQTGTGGGSTQGGVSGTATYPGGYYGPPQSPGGGAGPGTGGTGSGSGVAGSSGAGGSGSRTSGARSSSGSRVASSGFPVFRRFPWGHTFVVPPTFFNMNQVRLPRFPLGNPWDTNSVPLGSVVVPPPPPMSHIIQTSNGYQRARSVLSHSKFSPHEWSVLPLRYGQVQDGGQVQGWSKNVL